jgi:hypothetical protein
MEMFFSKEEGEKKQFISLILGYIWYYNKNKVLSSFYEAWLLL